MTEASNNYPSWIKNIQDPKTGQITGQEVTKPDWLDKAIALKRANPRMGAKEIGRKLGGLGSTTISSWLTGTGTASKLPGYKAPFTKSDFPASQGSRIYFDGDKPEWYDKAVAMRRQGVSYRQIANQLLGSVSKTVDITKWLVKGQKWNKFDKNVVNPDAPFDPRPKGQKVDVNLINSLINDGLTDEQIIDQIKTDKGPKVASQVKNMLPVLRQKLNPGTQVIDKTASGINNPVARPPKVIEAPMSYGQEGKPEWYDRAVQMKLDNPYISGQEIARQVGSTSATVLYWLTGSGSGGPGARMMARPKDSFPFEIGDFPVTPLKYYGGAKPKWYDQALKMAKAGETFAAIGKKFGVSYTNISKWLVKGSKDRTGKLINPDAELQPRRIASQKLDINLINSLITDYDLTDEEIIDLIIDEKGPQIANLVKDKLPDLRQKLKVMPQVTIDKTSGTDISGFIK